MEPEACSIVIVGAGLAGAATAYHLKLAGVQGVVLLEKEAVPGVHASGRNAAMLRERMDDGALQALATESCAVLRAGRLAAFQPTGSLLIGEPVGGAVPAAERVAVSARLPRARGEGRFHAEDGIVDVAALLQSYLHGQDVRYGVTLASFEAGPTGVALQTSAGPLQARQLVNATGAWAGALGDLPLTPYNRHLFVSAVDTSIDRHWPFLWDLAGGYYLRPESGGWLLCACDERSAAPGDYTQDPCVLEDLGRKLRRYQPDLGDLRIARQWVGQRTFAADRRPVIGEDPRQPGVFHVAGLGGHGVTLSWAVGRCAADALLGRAADAAVYDPRRLTSAPAPS